MAAVGKLGYGTVGKMKKLLLISLLCLLIAPVFAGPLLNFDDKGLIASDGKVVPVTPKVLDSLSENTTPQGIIAEVFMRETGELVLEDNEPILILDRIQDPGNMGTIIRTAAACGFHKIVLIDTVDQFSPKVVRASSCGIFYVDIYRMTEDEIISYCKANNVEMLVADMGGENIYKMKKPTKSFALVIGNEGQGVSDNFSNSGKIVSLPMKDQMESLNAGICASVMMYELVGDKI